MFDLVDAIFSMSLDVYTQSDVQDEDTGLIKKSWQYTKTIDCHAKAFISNSSTSRTGDRQTFGNIYENTQMLEITHLETLWHLAQLLKDRRTR